MTGICQESHGGPWLRKAYAIGVAGSALLVVTMALFELVSRGEPQLSWIDIAASAADEPYEQVVDLAAAVEEFNSEPVLAEIWGHLQGQAEFDHRISLEQFKQRIRAEIVATQGNAPPQVRLTFRSLHGDGNQVLPLVAQEFERRFVFMPALATARQVDAATEMIHKAEAQTQFHTADLTAIESDLAQVERLLTQAKKEVVLLEQESTVSKPEPAAEEPAEESLELIALRDRIERLEQERGQLSALLTDRHPAIQDIDIRLSELLAERDRLQQVSMPAQQASHVVEEVSQDDNAQMAEQAKLLVNDLEGEWEQLQLEQQQTKGALAELESNRQQWQQELAPLQQRHAALKDLRLQMSDVMPPPADRSTLPLMLTFAAVWGLSAVWALRPNNSPLQDISSGNVEALLALPVMGVIAHDGPAVEPRLEGEVAKPTWLPVARRFGETTLVVFVLCSLVLLLFDGSAAERFASAPIFEFATSPVRLVRIVLGG